MNNNQAFNKIIKNAVSSIIVVRLNEVHGLGKLRHHEEVVRDEEQRGDHEAVEDLSGNLGHGLLESGLEAIGGV